MRIESKLLVMAFLLVGCGQPLVKGSKPPTPAEGFFVFGSKPAHYQIQVFAGNVHGKVFVQDPWANATFGATPDNGYAVGRAKAGSILAVTRVFNAEQSMWLADAFVPCGATQTLVFTVEPGRVVYVADLDFRRAGNQLGV